MGTDIYPGVVPAIHGCYNGYAGAVFVSQTSSSSFERTTFLNNSAVGHAGAVNVFAGSIMTCVDCEFRGNTAGELGGAVLQGDASSLTFTGGHFFFNKGQ